MKGATRERRQTPLPLIGAQQGAADPLANVWLSASAGTGKTQVLTARVFRLLLRGDVRPENILCLTYTKAGANEMASRINAQLARWVMADAGALGRIWPRLARRCRPRAKRRRANCLPICSTRRVAVCRL